MLTQPEAAGLHQRLTKGTKRRPDSDIGRGLCVKALFPDESGEDDHSGTYFVIHSALESRGYRVASSRAEA